MSYGRSFQFKAAECLKQRDDKTDILVFHVIWRPSRDTITQYSAYTAYTTSAQSHVAKTEAHNLL